jgi:nitrite reductase/ring-hydroxylating ferredoxin subunit
LEGGTDARLYVEPRIAIVDFRPSAPLNEQPPVVTIRQTVGEGRAAVFAYRDEYGLLVEGFVFRRAGQLFCYRNQCRHQPLTLDYGDGQFFTTDEEYLLCRNHGALFVPETGKCIAGPCAGASLYPLSVVELEGVIHIYLPDPQSERDLE